MTVFIDGPSSSANAVGFLAGNSAGNSATTPRPRGMPQIVPASELYFWSTRWQAEEQAFERDRAEGRLQSYGTAGEAIRALLSD